MGRNERARQKSRQRKLAKQKQKKQDHAPAVRSGASSLAHAASWPLYECLASESWREEGGLVEVLVTRRSQAGNIGAALFLVDLGCLGVKDAFVRVFDSLLDYLEFVDDLSALQTMERIDFDLAAKIVAEGIAWAERFGFQPHRDYALAAPYLAGAHPEECHQQITPGKDGKPLYIAGPHDNVPRILARLDHAVGRGNYHALTPIDGPYI